MNKTELTAKIAEQSGITKSLAASVVTTLTGIVTEALKHGDTVQLPGFGTFETRTRAARTGVNPSTGEAMQIPETVVPAFRAGSALKEAVRA